MINNAGEVKRVMKVETVTLHGPSEQTYRELADSSLSKKTNKKSEKVAMIVHNKERGF